MKKVSLEHYKRVYSSQSTPIPIVTNRTVCNEVLKNDVGMEGVRVSPIKRGDEVIVRLKTGGAYRGWFIGTGNVSESTVALCWFPSWDDFELVYLQTVPISAEWTHYHSSPRLTRAIEQIEKLKQFQGQHFTFELRDEEIHNIP